MAWLAIDAGTSVIKAVLFADDGRELAVARAKTAVLQVQPGWSEQNMDDVWAAVVSTVRQVHSGGDPAKRDPIRGIVSTAQGDGCWLVDEHGRPTGNAILWNDGRAAGIVEHWRERGIIDRAFPISGSVAYPGLPNAILPWLAAHEPQRLQRARWALTANGWLFARMTGCYAADLSDASNPFSDVSAGAYSPDAIALYGAQAYAALLPPVLSGRNCTGALSETAAAELGLSAGLPVAMAPYDIVATAYGAGAALPGQACVILGTTICAEVLTASLELPAIPSGTTIALGSLGEQESKPSPHATPKLFLRAMPTLTGCEALEWAARMLGVHGIPALDQLAASEPALPSASPSSQPFFLPYLSPAGERSPFLAPAARGSFHGLALSTTRAAIARSVYEGLCFVIRECLEAAAPGALRDVRVCGGGARSDLWCGMIADVLGVPVVRAEGSEHGARGAHLFALAVTGEIASIAEGVGNHVADAKTFAPHGEASHLYNRRFNVFKALREHAREQWNLMASLG